MKPRIILLLFWVFLIHIGSHGLAATRDMKREAEIENQVAATNAFLLEPFRAARVAFDRDDFAEAERLLTVVCRQAPDLDVGWRRLGSAQVRLGKRGEGLQNCERAVTLNRSQENLFTLALNLSLGTDQQPASASEQQRAWGLLTECRKLPLGHDESVLVLSSQVALRLEKRQEFRAMNGLLREKHPDAMATHYFTAIEAAMDGQWVRSEDEIRKAQKLGLPQEAAEKFLGLGVHSRAAKWRAAYFMGWVVVAWLVGLGLLFALGLLLSRNTLRQAEAADVRVAVSAGEKRLRNIYRALLNVAGVYYYLSLPVVIVLVVGVVVAILYSFLLAGWLPIKLALLLALGAIFTIVAMIKSLFIRVNSEEPGRALQREEAEGLWALTEEVARTLETRPIDEIRITPGTDVAVYERGTWRDKLQNRAKRVLILGVGVLNGFRQDDFRCVLAHEYGHFSNRDTAGGDIGLRVRNDMIKFYIAMREAGQATLWNAAFHFLRTYNFIFRRISHGATRLQEILADRVAAQFYGAPALEGGLRHVIRRSLEFEASANQEIKTGIEARRPLQNLYELPPMAGSNVETDFHQALTRKTTEDDTHPSPVDRFRLVAPLKEPLCQARTGEVWDLFRDRAAITREMMNLLEAQIAAYRAQEPAAAAPAA